MSAVVASAPAKIILFGEHAVVYGQPAIAVPISDLRVTASVQPGEPGQGLRIVAADLDQTLPVDLRAGFMDNALALAARLTLERLGAPPADMTLTLHSQIPVASGLGSGAAVSTALARALSLALGQPMDAPTLNRLVYEVEKVHHGTPSGIDNTVIVYEQPVYFVRSQPIEPIRIGAPFTLLIADSGRSALTKIAIAAVRALYEADSGRIQPVFDAIGALVKDAKTAIEGGDIGSLGPLMTRNHEYLQALTVSSAELDGLVEAALKAGALGAKLSGGGRGGNMIALVMPEQASAVAEAMRQTGAVRVFQTVVR